MSANRQNRKQYGFSALSEPETRTIERLISQYAPDRIVSIHQPFACIDYDGPAKELAKRMAEYSDLPVKKLGPMTGSLGSYAGLSLGIPIVTLELLSNDENLNQHQLWQRYGKMLLAAITYPQRHE
jgi:protein MpaA